MCKTLSDLALVNLESTPSIFDTAVIVILGGAHTNSHLVEMGVGWEQASDL